MPIRIALTTILHLCPQCSVRVLPLGWRTSPCATKSECCKGPQESARNCIVVRLRGMTCAVGCTEFSLGTNGMFRRRFAHPWAQFWRNPDGAHSDWQFYQLLAHHRPHKLTSPAGCACISKGTPAFDPFARLVHSRAGNTLERRPPFSIGGSPRFWRNATAFRWVPSPGG